MEYIASHYHMDLPLVWALRLEGKTDQEKFKELGWGLRTWDQWNFNECDERFGDDWPARHRSCPKKAISPTQCFRSGEAGGPGRIPAQLVAHTLFYFTKPGDLVLDPTRLPRLRESNGWQVAGGGVVSDVCLLFERKCQSFDLALMDNRPEIQRYYWDPQNWTWPVTKKPDLIFFDPPYFSKKERDYEKKANAESPSISSYTKEEYESFLEGFFLLAHRKSKTSTSMALLNADWPARHRSRPKEAVSAPQGFRSGEAGGRDFESTPASKENPDNSITIFNYHRVLSKTGWEVTHRIECPLSSERLSGNQVQKMQDKRILGTVGRTLLIAKKS